MTICNVCLDARLTFQQCMAIRLYIWKLEPRSFPQPVTNPDSVITQLVLHLGSVSKAQEWLANWTLAYVNRNPSIPESQTSDTLVTSANVTGDPPHSGSSTKSRRYPARIRPLPRRGPGPCHLLPRLLITRLLRWKSPPPPLLSTPFFNECFSRKGFLSLKNVRIQLQPLQFLLL